MTVGPTAGAAHVAAMIVDAVERAHSDDQTLGIDALCAEVPLLQGLVGPEGVKRILVRAAARCAERWVADWQAAYPDDDAPVLALRAAQAWLENPETERASIAASLSAAALRSFAQVRGPGGSPKWPSTAWFARTCAWLADAPKYGWQVISALHGLVRAGARDCLLEQLEAALAEGERQPRSA